MSIVRRLMPSHGTIVLTIPKQVCRVAGLAAGDYVQAQWADEPGVVIIRKIHLPEPETHGSERHPPHAPHDR